jgi:hypothetical protein
MKELGDQDQMSYLHYFLLVNGREIERRGETLQQGDLEEMEMPTIRNFRYM